MTTRLIILIAQAVIVVTTIIVPFIINKRFDKDFLNYNNLTIVISGISSTMK